MKQQDIAIIIVVGVIGGVVAFFASGALFKAPQQQVEVVQAISSEFGSVDKRYFNQESINPTPTVTVGDNNNTDPFRPQGE